MRLANPTFEQSRAVLASSARSYETAAPTDVTKQDVRTMVLYLRKAKERAQQIRERSPAGSYLDSVLERTIDGITLELSQLEYLLAGKPVDVPVSTDPKRRMRPAI